MTKEIQCKFCGKPFPFTDGEQKWYRKEGFQEPKKCPACRAWFKARKRDLDYRQRNILSVCTPYRKARQSHYAPRVMGRFY